MTPPVGANRVPREQILGMARAAAALPEPARRRTVLAIMRERGRWIALGTDAGSEPTVLYEACGDAGGRAYWSAWLFPGKATATDLARLLSAHAAHGEAAFLRLQAAFLDALRPVLDRSAREMVERLLEDPDVSRHIPISLRAFISAEPIAAVNKKTKPAKIPPGKKPVLKTLVRRAMIEAQERGIPVLDISIEALRAEFKANGLIVGATTCNEVRNASRADLARTSTKPSKTRHRQA
jgi:hypothetical protein